MILTVRNTREIRDSSARTRSKRYSTARHDYLNASERKQLLANSLPEDIQYDDYLFLNEQWMMYYHSLIDTASDKHAVIHEMAKEGSIVKVLRAKMPQDVGLQGIVLHEGGNSYHVLTKSNSVKRINKRGHVFELMGLGNERVLINGDVSASSCYQFVKKKTGLLNQNPFK